MRVWKPNHINQKSCLKVTEIQSRNLTNPPIDKSDTDGSKHSNYIMGSISLVFSFLQSLLISSMCCRFVFCLVADGLSPSSWDLGLNKTQLLQLHNSTKRKRLSLLIFIYGFKGRLWIQRNGVLDHMLTQRKACLLTIMM